MMSERRIALNSPVCYHTYNVAPDCSLYGAVPTRVIQVSVYHFPASSVRSFLMRRFYADTQVRAGHFNYSLTDTPTLVISDV